MKNLLLLSTLALASFTAQTADLERGEMIFNQTCATCHGKQAEKMAMGQSPIIRNLEATEILQALQDRKAGKIQGMGNKAKARLSDDDMKNVTEYIESLK